MTTTTIDLQVRLSRWAGRELAVVGRSLSRHRTAGGIGGAAATLALAPMRALAQQNPPNCTTDGSSGNATTGLTNIINAAATFLIILGGALALLMLAIGGFLILGGGAKPDWVKKGMATVKYALAGVAILVSGVFIRSVVVNFIQGATGGAGIDDCANTLSKTK